MSIATAPARIDRIISFVMSLGARAPGTSTDPITTSASRTRCSSVSRSDINVMILPLWIWSMRAGAVAIDIAIDQGGCMETSRMTTHSDPTYVVDGVVHYCVGNMPGAVPNTSTYALTNVTLPYALRIAANGLEDSVRDDAALALGVNAIAGEVTNAGVAEAHGMTLTPLSAIVDGLS